MNKVLLVVLFWGIWLLYGIKSDIEYNKTHIERTRVQLKQLRGVYLDTLEYVYDSRTKNRLLFFHNIGYHQIFHEGFRASVRHLNYLIDNYDEKYIGLLDSRDVYDEKGELNYSMQYLQLSISLHHVLSIQDLMPGDEKILDVYLPDISTGEGTYVFQMQWLAENIKKKYESWLKIKAENIYWHVEPDRKRNLKLEQETLRDMETLIIKAKGLLEREKI